LTSTGDSGSGTTGGGNTSTGGSSTGQTDCILDGKPYPPGANYPAHSAECCNRTTGKWTPMFEMVASIPVASVTMVGPADGLIADLNGDGLSDVVVIVYGRGLGGDAGQSQTWVFLSEDGGFAGPTIYAAGQAGENGPGGVVLGDLNRDGIPDLITSTATSLDVRLGLGGGLFGSELSIPAPCSGGKLRVADVNLDGWPDVVEAMNCAPAPGGLFLFLNQATGDGTFSAATMITEDTLGDNLAVGDFNGDGYPDVAYENTDAGVSWLENTGQGFDGGGYLFLFWTRPITDLSSLSGDTGSVDDILITWLGLFYSCFPPHLDAGEAPSCYGVAEDFDVVDTHIAYGDVDGDGYGDFLFGGVVYFDGGSGVDVLLSDPPVLSEPAPGGQGLTGLQPLNQIAVGNLNGDRFGDLFVFRQDGPWEAWVNVCGPGAP
jgi:hypothetical protein